MAGQTEAVRGNGAAAALATAGEAGLAKPGAKPPLGFEPNDLTEAWRMAEMFSKSNLVPDALKKRPEDVLIVMLLGRELGLSPLASIRGVSVIQGKPYVNAQLKIALVQARKDLCKYFRCTHSDSESATFETERVGSEGVQRATFTFKDAEKAGLTNKSTWSAYRANMLRWRAASALIDYVYSDVVLAVGTEDEYEEVKEKDMGRVERSEGRARVLDEMEASMAPPIPEPPTDVNPETGEVIETAATAPAQVQVPTPPQQAAPPKATKASSGGDPDSAAEVLAQKLRTAAAAGDERAFKALAKEVTAFPIDIQARLQLDYQAGKELLAKTKEQAK